MYLLWVIIIGFLAGAIAKLFIGGPRGFIITTLLGIVGAIFATWLGQHIGWYAPGESAGFIGPGAGATTVETFDEHFVTSSRRFTFRARDHDISALAHVMLPAPTD